MRPVMLPASWVASTKRCKDAGSVHSSSLDTTEDAAARRVIAGQGAGKTLPGASRVMCPVTLRASWVASTKRCKDAGSVHSSSTDATEDAAARRVIAGQGA